MAARSSSQGGRTPVRDGGLPEGTVTFVFTDIEESTLRSIELGDGAWARLLEAHHRILREAFAAGVEVNTEGDGFFVAFASAPEALQAVVSAQRALQSYAWPEGRELRVRIGLHTGVALVRDGDYVGAEVARASRVCDAAHGGQILLSETTAALVGGGLPTRVVLVDVGLHRLKDLGSPQRLFGVLDPELGGELPTPRSLEAVANNLPVQRSVFIGRQAEIARVRTLLGGHGLVTLTGVGGAGKTRLALQVGAEELDAYPDGVFFVDLAPVSDPAEIGRAVADAAGLRVEGGVGGRSRPVVDVLVEVLARRQSLLLVDNCEHLLDGCAELAERLLAACSGVGVLATSREPLGVEGEQVYRVPSLSLPDQQAEDGPSQADGGTSEAVALFVERAKAADADFEPGDGLAVVGEICRRLDGIPLAIEFAAARVAHLSVGQIAARLDDRFALLTGGRRRVRRQQTLEAALDWSYQMLAGSEQALLRRLAVFAGSFELEMAEEICTAENLERAEILDLLGSLVDKSLVATETDSGGVRYRLLETVRAYAEDKLVEVGEAQRYRSTHRDAYLAWLEAFSWQALYLDGAAGWVLVGELANLRAALQWSKTQGRRDLVGRIAARGWHLWFNHGHIAEGEGWLAWALDAPDELDAILQAQCHSTLAYTILMTGAGSGPEGEQHAARAIELGGDHLGGLLVVPLGLRANGAARRFQATGELALAEEARALMHQVLEVGGQHGHPWTWLASWWHGIVMLTLGDLEAAERSLAAVVHDDLAATAPAWVRAATAVGLAVCHVVGGDSHGALEAVGRESERGAREPGIPVSIEAAAALAELQLGRPTTAAAHLRVALDHAHPEVVPLTLNEALVWAGAIAHELGQHATASRLLAAATHVGAAREAARTFKTAGAFTLYRHYLPRIRQALGPDEARRCRDQGQALTPDQAQATACRLADLMDP